MLGAGIGVDKYHKATCGQKDIDRIFTGSCQCCYHFEGVVAVRC